MSTPEKPLEQQLKEAEPSLECDKKNTPEYNYLVGLIETLRQILGKG